ncbi:hypothetical protein C7450_12242 [Chelatococcus asaccharovorans]|uniref:Uncharacterized protein n=1 Tax=Chelatococcus asaccharovorans TaxID=28210 RepID=A0A2V3TTE1_9HYPH|nr:hypothetical protein C7450_12242 [Chelatococcus asaccharovorans]
MRIIGLDVHRVAAEAAELHDGAFRKLGRIPMLRDALEDFARKNLTTTITWSSRQQAMRLLWLSCLPLTSTVS